ncbi:glutathione S-transferase [Rhizobium laguerreae]|nr:glutathione S-transferase [Rhizobium laguerreae]
MAPHILLYEIGEPFEAIETPVSSGAHLTSEFTRLNPKNRVPVLATEGHVITELPAISAAIALRAPDLGLMGGSPMENVRVLEWLNWLSGTVRGQGFGCLWRPECFATAESAFESVKGQGQATIVESYQAIEQRIGDAHASGTSFTVVGCLPPRVLPLPSVRCARSGFGRTTLRPIRPAS